MQNTIQLSDMQAIVVLDALKQECKHLYPEDKHLIADIHNHIRIQCSKLVMKAVEELK